MSLNECDLSVVIISRNEERNIARCIESVLKATKDIDNSEIVLVDSLSTDMTVAMAKEYPIRILQLTHKSQCSAAGGRFIGFLHTSGKYIQFLDGDMVLDENWIKNALPVLETDEKVAGVVGIATQEPYNTYSAMKLSNWMASLKQGEIQFFDGANLCKRSVLLELGGYNPYLRGHEETELSLRIIKKGYTILRLPTPMTHHLGGNESFATFLKKKLHNNTGLGQMVRYHLDDKATLRWFLKEYKFFMAYILFYVLGLAIISISYFFGIIGLIYVWVIGFSFLLIYNIMESKSTKNSIIYPISSLPRGFYFILGFLRPTNNPKEFPKAVTEIG